jgi:hypothetical protein
MPIDWKLPKHKRRYRRPVPAFDVDTDYQVQQNQSVSTASLSLPFFADKGFVLSRQISHMPLVNREFKPLAPQVRGFESLHHVFKIKAMRTRRWG